MANNGNNVQNNGQHRGECRGSKGRFDNVVGSLLDGMEGILSTKTVVGQPTVIGDTIILPLVDVTFAVGAGAADRDKESNGMGGLGGKMTPSAILVIKNGQTKLVNIKNQDTITKVLDMVPDLLDRFISRGDSEGDDDSFEMPADCEVVDIAFPEEGDDGSGDAGVREVSSGK